MPTITIRHVPDEVRDELASRAASSGRSLQEFMLAETVRLASRPALTTLIEQVRTRKAQSSARLSRDDILADLETERR